MQFGRMGRRLSKNLDEKDTRQVNTHIRMSCNISTSAMRRFTTRRRPFWLHSHKKAKTVCHWSFKVWSKHDSSRLNCYRGKLRVPRQRFIKYFGGGAWGYLPYLGRQRPHRAGCHPRWYGSPWWCRLHLAAPRHCWRWRCCCSCSCSSLCGRAAPTPFSNTPLPWMIQEGERRGVVKIQTGCAARSLHRRVYGGGVGLSCYTPTGM